MKYRPEIDGLRALAVIPVILFHAGFELFSGGFVGVDIFFVISGFLITSILINEIENDKFSLLKFYERRALRILPALFTVMLFCLPLAYLWMFPIELKNFSQSLIAVVFFMSNILFWLEEGYFAASSELKPLLHTWSLAVEEQYYLIFPIFLMLGWRIGKTKILCIIVIVSLLSLLLSEWSWRNDPSANFYLAPTRAWELLAGSICAFLSSGQMQKANNFLSSLGLVLIFFAIFYYDKNTPFPSVYSLVPVLGAVLIIMFASEKTWAGQLLSMRCFVGIGLISYSAYLWHQPLFAFARLRILPDPHHFLMIGLFVATFLLAWATWYLVEQPFRKRKFSFLSKGHNVFVISGVFALLFAVIGLYGHFGDGFKQRSNGEVVIGTLGDRIEKNYGLHMDCDSQFNGSKINNSKNCYTSPSPKVLLWGDSHAMHLVQGILASEPDVDLQQHTLSSCAPILGLAPILSTKKLATACIEYNNSVFSWLTKQNEIEIVVLSSLFAGISGKHLIQNDGSILPNVSTIEYMAQRLRETVNAIQKTGAKVVIVSTTPRSGWDNGRCLVRSVYFDVEGEPCDFVLNKKIDAYELLQILNQDIPIYWLSDDICDDEKCNAMKSGIFILKDRTHLSKEGSEYLGKFNKWMPRFRAITN